MASFSESVTGFNASEILVSSGTIQNFILPENSQFGSKGSGNGEFENPQRIAINGTGHIYVVDTDNHRIQIFDSTGNYLSQFGSEGSGNGEFENPVGIAINDTGHIYVVDPGTYRVQIFDSSGNYLSQFGSGGSGNGEFNYPLGIAINSTGHLYITDVLNFRIQIFDNTGKYLSQFGNNGTGDGQFVLPVGIAINDTNHVYVTDTVLNSIQIFDNNGKYLSQFGSEGSDNGQFQTPIGMAFSSVGNLYVTDLGNNRIQVFDGMGSYLYNLEESDNDFLGPVDVKIDSAGTIYVLESRGNSVHIIDLGYSFDIQDPEIGVLTVKIPANVAQDKANNGNTASNTVSLNVITIPGAPSTLSATPGNTQITLDWAVPAYIGGSPITGYVIQHKESTNSWPGISVILGNITSTVITGLTNGIQYDFRINATNAAGTGASSGITSATPLNVPGVPTDLVATPGNTQVTLSWIAPFDDGGSAITDYVIEYSVDAGTSWNTFVDGTVTATSTTVTGLTNGQAYQFRVSATNTVGTGVSSDTVDATPKTIPAAPTDLAATPGNTQVSLSWTAPTNNGGSAITDYAIQYSTDGSSWATFNDDISTTTSVTVTGLTNGQAYYFRVNATNQVGTGPASGTAQATPIAPDTIPPTIELNGDNPATISIGTVYNDAGATCTDNRDSDPTLDIVSTVDASSRGQYTVTYTCIDDAGNNAKAIRTVNVITVPGAPTSPVPNSGNTQVALSWTAPTDNGGSAITGYTVQHKVSTDPWPGISIGIINVTSATITGLTNGVQYDFRINATNAAGTGVSSGVISATPSSVAGSPTGLTATPGNTQVSLSWTTPTDNGGSAITDYTIQYSANAGTSWSTFADGTVTGTTAIVTNLTNGDTYQFRVSAVNDAGTSTPSDTVDATPRTIPAAPTGLAATPGNTQVSLSWTAPTDNGGSAITGYIIQHKPSTDPWPSTSTIVNNVTSGTITNLTNGVTYDFRINATNVAGTGASSGIVSATPRSVPGQPTGLTATPGNTQVSLSWTAPTDNGGSAITDYTIQYSANAGTLWTTFNDGTNTATSTTITGLTNGDTYRFQVFATNTAGTGIASDTVDATPRTIPAAPTGLAAIPGNTQVSLSWTAPTDNGGSAITDYTIQYSANAGTFWSTFADGTSAATTATVSSLTNGDTYQFRVSATNVAGTGPASGTAQATPVAPDNTAPTITINGANPVTISVGTTYVDAGATCTDNTDTNPTLTDTSTVDDYTAGSYTVTYTCVDDSNNSVQAVRTVIVITVPSAPTSPVATPGNTQVSLSWTAPTNNGGSAITGYIIQHKESTDPWPGISVTLGNVHSTTITGLTNGVTYDFRINATNVAGTGVSSGITSATPISVAGSPTGLTATPGNTQVELSWTAPSNNGGSAITDYVIEYSATAGSSWTIVNDGIATSTTTTVTGLTNGQAYQFRVSTVNQAGNSIHSGTVDATPITIPAAPTGLTATPGNTQVALSWTAPTNNGGSAITDYAIQYSINGSIWNAFNDGISTTTSANVTGLTNGQVYHFRVNAINVAGTGPASGTAQATPVAPDTKSPIVPDNKQITPDIIPPVITINGDNPVTVTLNTTYTDAGATCTDIRDSDPTLDTVSTVDTSTVGSYTVTYTCVDDAGNNAVQQIRTVNTITVPSAPTGLIASFGNTTNALSWTAPTNNGGSTITDYVIQYSTNSSWTIFNDDISTTTSTNVTGLTNGQVYHFRVNATNAAGTGPASDTVQATPVTSESTITVKPPTTPPKSITPTEPPTLPPIEPDTTPPVIVINGDNLVTITLNTIYADAGATCTDNLDPNPTLTQISTVDTSTVGSYTVTYSCTDDAGNTAILQVRNVIVITVPDIPTNLIAVAENTRVSLSWTAPDNGGSPITGYVIQHKESANSWPGTSTSIANLTSVTITSLTNGIQYDFRLSATNDVGTGPASGTVQAIPVAPDTTPPIITINGNNPVTIFAGTTYTDAGATCTDNQDSDPTLDTVSTVDDSSRGQYTVTYTCIDDAGNDAEGIRTVNVITVPGAPTNPESVAENTRVSLSWTAPDNGGSAITGYTIQHKESANSWPGISTILGNITSATITSLTNGVQYDFRINATNAAGTGVSSGVTSATPSSVPDAPTDLSATPGNTQISLSWTAPTNNGGSVITDYTIQYSADTGTSWNTFTGGIATVTSATVTGLTNGQLYQFRVSAVNEAGTGVSSGIASSTPRTIPAAPTNLTATLGDAQIVLSWTAPDNGGSPITGYVIQHKTSTASWPGVTTTVGNIISHTISSLTNGIQYDFRINATNVAGTGASSSVTSATPVTFTVPDTIPPVIATPADAIIVHQNASFTATDALAGVTCTDTEDSNPTLTADITNVNTAIVGSYTVTYSCTDVANNSAVQQSRNVTVIGTPAAPTGLTATSGDAQISVSWTAPTNNGGSAITGYVIQYKTSSVEWPSASVVLGNITSTAIIGLTNGVQYDFRINATNTAGTGASSGVTSATPSSVPGIPTGLVAIPGNEQVSLSWTAPSDTGGFAITDYVIEYSANAGTSWNTFNDGIATSTTTTVTGLTNGQAYQFRVSAVNNVGTGVSSGMADATPRTIPAAPIALTASAGNANVFLSWTAPYDTGGSAITDYTIQYSANAGTSWSIFADGTSAATTATVSSLTNGNTYHFRINATNIAGTGPASGTAHATPVAPDNTAPVITINGDNYVTITLDSTYTDAGATCTDNLDSDPTLDTVSTVDTSVVGSYTVTYTCTDDSNNSAKAIRTVIVITVPDAPTALTATPEDAQVSLFWTAPDNGGSPITGYVIQHKESANSWPGTSTSIANLTSVTITSLTNGIQYDFRLSATNDVGTGPASGTVQATPTPPDTTLPIVPDTTLPIVPDTTLPIVPDTTPPVIVINGDNLVTITLNTPYTDAGAICIDNLDSDPTLVVNNNVDTSAVGSYTVTYTCTDDTGNNAVPQIRTVTVIGVPGAPTDLFATPENSQVSLSWIAPKDNGGSVITDYIIQFRSATDITWNTFRDDTSYTTSVTVTGLTNGVIYQFRVGAVNDAGTGTPSDIVSAIPTKPQEHIIKDTHIEDISNLEPDITSPIITINGDNPVTISVGTTYTDAGATCIDNLDPNPTLTQISTVDITIVGSYAVTYSCTDDAGNTAVPQVRNVNGKCLRRA